MAAKKNKIFSGRKPPRRKTPAGSGAAPAAGGISQQELQEIRTAVQRVNSNLRRAYDIGGSFKADILGTVLISVGDYITPSGMVSATIAKSGQPRIRERLDSLNDFLKARIHEYKQIPEDIYDMWQECIRDYFNFLSNIGVETMRELAPITTQNIQDISKASGSDKNEFQKAVQTWQQEKHKVWEYLENLSNAPAWTDSDWM